MPVIRPGPSRNPTLNDRLAELLVKELMGEAIYNGPVIFEDPVDQGEVDVIVVWEAWMGVSASDRPSIIREAYKNRARMLEASILHIDPAREAGIPMIPKVRMAVGVTGKEALESGLLPFSIRPTAGDGEVERDEVETLMIEAGAFEMQSGSFELRSPTKSMATNALDHLNRKMPEAGWILEGDGSAVDRD